MSQVKTVRPGESIQRALDEAGPGASIVLTEGTYTESVWIRHGGVSLTGAGPGRTVLTPGDGAAADVPRLHDASEGVVSGITVHGDAVANVRIEALTVTGFSGAGIYAHSVAGVSVRDVEARGNAVWGVYLRESSGCEVSGCRASGSQYGGVALSFCPDSDGLIAGNETSANAFGVFVDNSSGARVVRNACHGNAIGMLLLNQVYEGEPAGGVRDCLVAGNDLHGNGLAAGAEPDGLGAAGPPISGVGLALIGTHRVAVVDNHIHDNHPSGESVMGAGFVIGSSKDWGGDDALDNHVLWNRITGNTPLDFQLGADLTRQTCAGNVAGKGDPAELLDRDDASGGWRR
ncbi:right-handed parallel beta-helix repeat-containing protein [Nonomuraea sp. SMC257]|uniref:Right-handed parallel beta-helix repeat-containing protein n=1 Tax=Nonomuraea montanisoli TaxID=2741721 RepID=A0A7Y6IBN9_9ACTN|nr:right-handed parallel beta-helix repeat-containing protein [Nonomuraea montanisoli]NUW34763.1 right-handed parallel beta-helix repeat-containing protein [Nonomuraea montanisoli]